MPCHIGHICCMVNVERILLNPFIEGWNSFENHPFNHKNLAMCDHHEFLGHVFVGNQGKMKAQ